MVESFMKNRSDSAATTSATSDPERVAGMDTTSAQ